jgi:hypothetical protein
MAAAIQDYLHAGSDMLPDVEPEADLRIKRITLIDLGPFGPQPFVIDCEAPVVIISGRNWEGKTTILKVLKSLHHEHDARLIRQGCTEGRAIYEYTDGTVIEHVFRLGGSDRIIRHADGRVIRTGTKKQIEELATGWGIDPMMLVTEKDKQKRKKFLLNVLPINFSKQEIDARLGEATRLAGEIDLAVFDQFAEALREKRKDQRKTVKNYEAMLAENERQIPAREETDWFERAKEITTQLNAERSALDSEVTTRRSQNVIDHNILQAKLDAEIAEIRAEAERKIANAKQAAQCESEALEASKNRAIDHIFTKHQSEIDRLISAKAEAEAKAKNQQQIEGVRKLIEQTREHIREEGRKADLLDDQVKSCEELRNEKLSQLPIKGIEIKDTEIFYNGKDFDAQLSTSEQIEASMKICALAAGKLPVMILDQAESLDEIREAEIIEKAKRNGFQVFMTKVVRGKPLTIEKAA